MDSPKTDLARVWADAPSLYEYVADRAERETRKSTSSTAVVEAGDTPEDATTRAFRGITLVFEQTAVRKAAFEKAQKATLNDLIANRIVCLGREAERYEFIRIASSFWIGANVEWYGNAMRRGERHFVELRVLVEAQTESPPKAEPDSDSIKAVILAAIKHHATANNDDKLRWPRFERYRAYRAYITSLGYQPRKQRGFSDKNFEKYETEYRKKLK